VVWGRAVVANLDMNLMSSTAIVSDAPQRARLTTS
jgi:hypothetical protein